MPTPSFIEKVKAIFSAADTIVAVRSGNHPYIVKGTAPKRLLQEIEDILKERKGTAYIYQYGRSRDYHLTFSSRVPSKEQQRLRNVWGIHSR